MKWTEKLSLPCEVEMAAGPLTLRVWKAFQSWLWEVGDGTVPVIASGITQDEHPNDSRTHAQARCLAVANGILLQRARLAWGGDAYVRVGFFANEARGFAVRVAKSWGADYDIAYGTTETEALVKAIEAAK